LDTHSFLFLKIIDTPKIAVILLLCGQKGNEENEKTAQKQKYGVYNET